MKEYRRVFLAEVMRVFRDRDDIDPQAKQYLDWIVNLKYLDPKTADFAFKDRFYDNKRGI
jgi:hypothetical protein